MIFIVLAYSDHVMSEIHVFVSMTEQKPIILTLRLLMSYIYICIYINIYREREHLFLACGRSPAEIVGSNPTGDMDICLL